MRLPISRPQAVDKVITERSRPTDISGFLFFPSLILSYAFKTLLCSLVKSTLPSQVRALINTLVPQAYGSC